MTFMGQLCFAGRMLKLLVFHKRLYGNSDFPPLMQFFFWREWLLQQEAGLRTEYENGFKTGVGKAPSSDSVAKLVGDLRKLRDGKLFGLSFTEKEERIRLVLQPATESSKNKRPWRLRTGKEKGREGE